MHMMTTDIKIQHVFKILTKTDKCKQNWPRCGNRNLCYGDHGKDKKQFFSSQLAWSYLVAHVPDIAEHLACQITSQQDCVDHIGFYETILPIKQQHNIITYITTKLTEDI